MSTRHEQLGSAADLIERLALSHDASHYRIVPDRVERAQSEDDVVAALQRARGEGSAVTFRSGGTSLSGQASGGSLVLDTRRHFRRVEVLEGGRRVRVQPGATVRSVNARLSRFGRRLGPDPASESACTVGGVIANNSSGMQCGTVSNAYATLDTLRMVLPSGTVVDTSSPAASDLLRRSEPELFTGLESLRDRVRGNPESVARIAQQYAMKNTMGYGVNSLVDFDDPVDILAHLMIGSEGTLGFVSEAVLRTVAVPRFAATAFLMFQDVGRAADAIVPLSGAGAATIELLDPASLRVTQTGSAVPAGLSGLLVNEHTALLVELQSDSEDELLAMVDSAQGLRSDLGLVVRADFERDAEARAAMWRSRKELYPRVAAGRRVGTTALLEDVAVPVERLPEAVTGLASLLASHGYGDSVTFGHAKDGNLHFMLTCRFEERQEVARYAAFTEDLVDLVLDAGGTLKAEHGTGRVMAPFVERQFGGELYAVMRGLKELVDPSGIMNPGVLITADPREHLQNLKTIPVLGDQNDRCVDCGFCEPACPSQDVTLTPRQRIALLREGPELLAPDRDLRRGFDYQAVDTCAADSLCSMACPVDIDTGATMKALRQRRHGWFVRRLGLIAATGFGLVVPTIRLGLALTRALPQPLVTASTRALRALVGQDWVPLIDRRLPAPGRLRRPLWASNPTFVYFPSCMSSVFGGTTSTLPRLAELAGERARIPSGISSLCCGTPWGSKGLADGHREMARRTASALLEATDHGTLPVVADASSCLVGLRQLSNYVDGDLRDDLERIVWIDATRFAAEVLVPRLPRPRRLASVLVHPTCSGAHLGDHQVLVCLASTFADTVVVPEASGCCGFAGDRGLLHPELTAAATAPVVDELHDREFDAYVSTNRACEVAMTRATGREYRHVLDQLLDQIT